MHSCSYAMALSGSLLVAAGLCAIPATAARAQAESQSNSASEETSPGLTEIVVTARKRIETIQSIPESIEAFGAEEISDAHITRIDDLGNFVSNLNITTRADNTPDVVLRGVGSFGVVSGVGFYADDVQLFDGQTVRTEDIERIEVLKGPQGTLYGGSNIGGAIKYVSKLPTDDFEAGASVEFGNYSTQTYSGFVSGPLVDGVLDARASFFDTHTDGYIYDTTLNKTVDGGSERGGRLTFLYKGATTTATLYLNYDWTDSGVGASIYYRPATPTDYSLQVADGTQPSYLRGLYSATLKVEQQINEHVNLTSISSYFHSYADVTVDIDKGPLPFLTGYQAFKTDVGSQELRLASAGDAPLKWLVGVFAQANDPSLFNVTRSFNGDPSNPANFNDPTQYSDQDTDSIQRHREYAVFGNVSYDWAKWTFETGVRADYNNSSLTDPLYNIANGQHGTEILPKFSAIFHFDKDVMGYGTISRGFQPGDEVEQFDLAGKPYVGQYDSEKTWNYELGFKSTFLERIRFNAAVFYIQYQNRLFQTVGFEGNGQFIQVTQNIGPSHNYGAEFDFSTRITQDLLLTSSFGVTKAIWGNVPYYDPDLNQPTNLDGRTAPYTPAYQGSVSLDWSHHVTGNLVFGLRADSTFVGQQNWDPTDHYQQPAYQLVNFGIRLEGSHWSVSGHVSNVFDKLYNTEFISAAEVQAPFNVAGIGRPRLWTVALKYRW